MSNTKYAKLIMVTENNNNKYYEMSYSGGSSFTVKYGRVESTAVTDSYPISLWDKKYNEKVKKGYKDVTENVAIVKQVKDDIKRDTIVKVGDSVVDEFLQTMKDYTDKLVTKTYSVKHTSVTQKQIDTAQKCIDDLNLLTNSKKKDSKKINELLIQLYTTIPRYMSKVQDNLEPKINVEKVLVQEQDNLDAMASQVKMYNKTQVDEESSVKPKEKNLLDIMGITMKECKDTKELQYLLDQIKGRPKIERIYEVKNPKEEAVYDKWLKGQKDLRSKILIHGTRCTSVLPILEIGLKIRPLGNFQFSGKAYGDGNYFSEVVQKSLGYTGYDNDKVLLVYEVHTGNPFVYNGWYTGNSFPLNYKELQKRGFDSTYVKAGNGLLNSEIIAYNEEQCKIKYIIWLKN